MEKYLTSKSDKCVRDYFAPFYKTLIFQKHTLQSYPVSGKL